MKKYIFFIITFFFPLVVGADQLKKDPNCVKIDQLYWDKGWFSSDLYIHTDNNMWWQVLSYKNTREGNFQVGDMVGFELAPSGLKNHYILIDLDHYGEFTVQYFYGSPKEAKGSK
jgi:hypothetical protein